jgi:hypothetical protein
LQRFVNIVDDKGSAKMTLPYEIGPIDTPPSKTLDAWHIGVVPSEGRDRPWTAHVFGCVRETCRGWVSSAIVRIDPAKRLAVTESGRVYHLAGQSDLNGDALVVWGTWQHKRSIEQDVWQDGTEEVDRLFARAAKQAVSALIALGGSLPDMEPIRRRREKPPP